MERHRPLRALRAVTLASLALAALPADPARAASSGVRTDPFARPEAAPRATSRAVAEARARRSAPARPSARTANPPRTAAQAANLRAADELSRLTRSEAPPALPFRVVIDPGHGGHDEGTVYDNGRVRVAEKDVTLRLAREAARWLTRQGIDVTLTRETDRDLSLAGRTALANRLGADVFISLHLNSTATPMVAASPQGIETYILNNTTDASSRRLARLENTVVSVDPVESPEGMDVALILKDLRLDGNLTESKRLACAVQGELVAATRPFAGPRPFARGRPAPDFRDRGVRQALFHVLLGADMPSILVEAGFLTHPRDRALVLSPEGQQAIGRALGEAVARYRDLRRPDAAPKKLAQLSSCKVN